MLCAPYSHRQRTEYHLLGEVGYVDTPTDDHVAFAERIRLSSRVRIETLVNLRMHVECHRLQTDVAVADCVGDDGASRLEPSFGVAQLQLHVGGSLETYPLEALDGRLVDHLDGTPAAGQQPREVDRVPPNQTRPF